MGILQEPQRLRKTTKWISAIKQAMSNQGKTEQWDLTCDDFRLHSDLIISGTESNVSQLLYKKNACWTNVLWRDLCGANYQHETATVDVSVVSSQFCMWSDSVLIHLNYDTSTVRVDKTILD